MSVNFSDDSTNYVSIWPEMTREAHEGEERTIKPIQKAENLQSDIRSQGGKNPENKIIKINFRQEAGLKQALNKLQEEFEADIIQRAQWSILNNCSTYIATLLYDAGISVIKPDNLMTPRKIFYLMDPVEQKVHLENFRESITKP